MAEVSIARQHLRAWLTAIERVYEEAEQAGYEEEALLAQVGGQVGSCCLISCFLFLFLGGELIMQNLTFLSSA